MTLKEQLIRLGKTNPELRGHLRPVLAQLAKKSRSKVQRQFDEVKELVERAMERLNEIPDDFYSYSSSQLDVQDLYNRLRQVKKGIDSVSNARDTDWDTLDIVTKY